MNWNSQRLNQLTLGIVAGGTILGIVARLLNYPSIATGFRAVTVGAALIPLTASVASALWHRKLGVDVIALLAMAGALLLGQYLAGAVIALMLAGGQGLEHFADSRARRELSALIQRAPRFAHRCVKDDVASVNIDEVKIGDMLLVKPGEVVPANSAGGLIKHCDRGQ